MMILGLDIGSSSVRAALYDERGNLLPDTLVKNERKMTATDDGGAEIDAEVAFKQVVAAIDELLVKTEKIDDDIAAVASCAFWHSLVGVDANGKPTTKVLGWADTRSREQTAVLRKRFDEPAVHNRTGARFHSSFWPAKLLCLRKDSPDVFERTTSWLSFSDFVAMRLFGSPVTSVSMASGTGILGIRKCDWDGELLKFLKLKRTSLPTIVADGETFKLSPKFAKRWPRLSAAAWMPSIADGAANNIGSGSTKKSRAGLMIGTSGAMRVAYKGDPPAEIPPGLWCYRIDRRRVIVGGALSDGGGLYAWLKDHLRLEKNDDEIAAEMSRRGADAHGLTVMPFFSGERSTGYNEDAAGAVLGLRQSHDSIDILQAAMEAVAYRFAEIFDQLKSVISVREIVASGGALESSAVWTQIVADVLGRDLNVFSGEEASMRGAVLLALETAGKIENIQGVSVETLRTRFHPKCHAIYKAARLRHKKHYDALTSNK